MKYNFIYRFVGGASFLRATLEGISLPRPRLHGGQAPAAARTGKISDGMGSRIKPGNNGEKGMVDRHLILIQSVIRRLRSEKGDNAEILCYELELTAERVKSRHEELNRHLRRLLGRDAVYKLPEENGNCFD